MSAEDERSPKRQRRSYSPASPPDAASDAKSPVGQQPQTPPPSVHMSPSWPSQQVPGLQHTDNGNGSGSVTFPTPPSTAGFQSQMMGRGVSSEGWGGADSGEPTPAQEGEGAVRRNEDGDGDAEMGDTLQEAGGGDVAMTAEDADAEHRRSDHERQEAQDAVPPLPATDVLYKLRTEPIPSSQPHPTQNLLELYGLQRIQASVARRNPITGEKINKLRKSYEGKIKDLGIEGRNKATKGEKILEGLVDPGWDAVLADGRPFWEQSEHCDPLLSEDSENQVAALLEKTLEMRPGHLPPAEHQGWKNLLGLDDASPTATAARLSGTAAATPNGPAKTPTSTNPLLSRTFPQSSSTALRNNNSAPASPRTTHLNNTNVAGAARPERAGKKRRYDESSYAGYQEGYEDDGYSTGGGMDERRGSGGRSANKRQKRKVSGRQIGFYTQQGFEALE